MLTASMLVVVVAVLSVFATAVAAACILVSEGGRELVLWSWRAGGLEASGIDLAWGMEGIIRKPGFLI